MKKITKLFSVFATLLTVFGTLVNLATVFAEGPDTTQPHKTTVVVHKIVMNEEQFGAFNGSSKDPRTAPEYDGNKINNLTGYFGDSAKEVAGVNFKVWQKVDAADTGTKTGETLGIAGDNGNYKLVQDYQNGVNTVDTGDKGASFTLVDGTYIFTEDKEASSYYNGQNELTGMKAVPFKLELPQAKTDGTGYFSENDKLHVYPKNTEDKPEIKKTFGDDTTDKKDVNIGDDIDYKITTTVPKDAAYKTFAWEDTMVAGLDFTLGSLAITSTTGQDPNPTVTTWAKDTDYSLVETKRGFMVKLNATGLAKLETAAKAGDVNFTLTYNATLNDSAAVDTDIPNKVKLIYGNRPSDFSEPKSTTPVNGEITVEKTWGDGVAQTPVTFGVYEKETGVKVGEITLPAGQRSATSNLQLKDGVEYLVIEETKVPGSLPTYSNDTPGTIKVENKKNPNPEPLEPEEPKVVTYGKRFIKTDDATDTNAVKKLVGAEFIVTNEDGTEFLALKDRTTQEAAITAYKNAEAAYVAAVKENAADIQTKKADRDAKYEAMNMQWTWVPNKADAFTFVSSADGKFEVKGLKAGTYKLVETKAPEGYALLTTPISFTTALNTWTDDSTTAIEGHKRVENKKVTIPQTGGIGTLVFTVVGLSTMVFAYIAMKKRQSEEA